MARNKYNAKPVTVDGHRFPSKREAHRYGQLKLLQIAGEVKDLKLQPRFHLLGPNGALRTDKGRIFQYVADFCYIKIDPETKEAQLVVEDVKSPITRTPLYLLKKAIMENMGYVIVEI